MPSASKRPTSLKASVYEQIARIGQAASSPSRLELLELLSQGPRTVEALAGQTGQSVATTSHHLQVLRRARLVDAEKAGLYVTYRLADPRVDAFLLDLRHLAESRLAEIQQITHQFLDARGLANGVCPVGHQAQHRHDHDEIEAPVWKRQLLDPAFDESRTLLSTARRSRGRRFEHRAVRIDADRPRASFRQRPRQQAVSASEIQDSSARDRADEIDDARPLERCRHTPEP